MIALRIIAKYAKKARHKQHHHIAILTRAGSIVAVGTNHEEIHAEIAAMNRVWPDQRRGLTLWSMRMTKGGKLAMAMPCPDCQKRLIENGITKVRFSDSDGQIQSLKL